QRFAGGRVLASQSAEIRRESTDFPVIFPLNRELARPVNLHERFAFCARLMACTTAGRWLSAAQPAASRPVKSVLVTLAPFASRANTTSMFPRLAGILSGVLPFL